MKASSESGECASLISVVLPGAGFVGMAFCDFSVWTFSLMPASQPQSHSGPHICQANWSHREIGDTPASKRGTSEADSTSEEASLFECRRVAHSALPDNCTAIAAAGYSFLSPGGLSKREAIENHLFISAASLRTNLVRGRSRLARTVWPRFFKLYGFCRMEAPCSIKEFSDAASAV